MAGVTRIVKAARDRLPDRVAIGVLTKTFPPGLVDAVIDQAKAREQPKRSLPARLTLYFTLAMWLWREHGYEEVLRQLLDGLGWSGADGDSDGPAEADVAWSGSISKARAHRRQDRDRSCPATARAGTAWCCAGRGSADLATLVAAYRRWALEHPRLYELSARHSLDRPRLASGVEAATAAPLLKVTGGNIAAARAIWGLAHGLVDLELANRFPPNADFDAAWAHAISAFAIYCTPQPQGDP